MAKSALVVEDDAVERDLVPPLERGGMELSPETIELVIGCLEKDPDHRPPSAGELARRIEGIACT